MQQDWLKADSCSLSSCSSPSDWIRACARRIAADCICPSQIIQQTSQPALDGIAVSDDKERNSDGSCDRLHIGRETAPISEKPRSTQLIESGLRTTN
jgi:hypothetical protein